MTDARYHVELKAFPHTSRVFNLDRSTLDERYVKPWSAGEMIEHDDERWPADRTKLTVYLAPALSDAQLGLGRGWGEVTRHGRDVTERVLAEIHRGAAARPEVEALKDVLAEVAAGGGLRFGDAVALAAVSHSGWRASEQLGLAEQAVWEMLHRGQLELLDADLVPIPAARWQEIVLAFGTWADEGPAAPRLRAPTPGTAA